MGEGAGVLWEAFGLGRLPLDAGGARGFWRSLRCKVGGWGGEQHSELRGEGGVRATGGAAGSDGW